MAAPSDSSAYPTFPREVVRLPLAVIQRKRGKVMSVPLKLFLTTALMAGSLTAQTSPTAQQLTTRCDPPDGSLARLTRTQKKAFLESQDMLLAGHYGDALAKLRGLLAQLPQNTQAQNAMAERTAEAALWAGDRAYAISLLKPIEEHDGSDCRSRTHPV